VFWWRSFPGAIELPQRAVVVAVGSNRIKIRLQNASTAIIRHVLAGKLQPIEAYYEKSPNQEPYIGKLESWGRFTRCLEVGEDLSALRQVDVFRNGNTLCYDRGHWVDDFGMLADGRINRNRKHGHWGRSSEIPASGFEEVWAAARSSSIWRDQLATAAMSRLGAAPPWIALRVTR
jgi:hypothetical protein